MLNAQEVARVAMDLRKTGFIPDVMLGHNGWGEIWYLKDIFPEAPLIGYFEFFYRMTGADVGFDPDEPITPDTAPRLRTKNLGAPLPPGETFRKRMLAELGDSLDLSRVHVYLTFPFVLSWSMLEAMSAGCLVVGSRTQPVEEVIHHGGNGLLVNFFSPDEIADRVIEALEDGRSFASLRQNARQTITDRFDLRSICLPAHLRLLNMLVPREQRASVTAARVACGQ